MEIRLANKLNKNPLALVEKHKDNLSRLVDSVADLDESEERDEFLSSLQYAMNILKQHYRNMLHCYSVAEKADMDIGSEED